MKDTNKPDNLIDKLEDYSVLRESVLNWYEFKKDATVLELAGGNSMIAGLLARRCKAVTVIVENEEQKNVLNERYGKLANLNILINNSDILSDKEYIGCFDYVICLDGIEKIPNPADSIKEWISYVKADGRLIIGCDNRFGIKYFCGSGDKYTDIPFDGINGYIRENTKINSSLGRCYSKAELVDFISEAGDVSHKFYYPVPDSRIPQMIFSDNYKNGINASERLIDYNYLDRKMLGVEHRIFKELIDEGSLPFMANSFIIEISKDGQHSDIDYAVVTTDRGENNAMATTVRSNGNVYKRPIWNAGVESLKSLYDKTLELKQCGVSVVDVCFETDNIGSYLKMPYVDKEGLSLVLERLSEQNKDKFLEIFDRVYRAINLAYDNKTRRTFIDLAPCNAFYDQDKDEIIFYDQEFVLENASTKFGMFRTIKYFFASSKKSRENISVEEMYERYGITKDKIEEFERIENNFINSIRNKADYQWLYKMATPDYNQISINQDKLAMEKKPYHIGYVPGVYDLFHVGHLRLFERCKARCDYLIVGVLTDELVEFYKGKKPVISYENRVGVIEGLSVVDKVIPVDFSNTDKLDAYEQLHYDCHFSGDDHVGHWDDIIEELRKRGSNMEFFSYTQGISSTAIKKKMQE